MVSEQIIWAQTALIICCEDKASENRKKKESFSSELRRKRENVKRRGDRNARESRPADVGTRRVRKSSEIGLQ